MARLGWVVGFAALAAACASAPEPEPLREPSPRPECAEAQASIYFTEDSATLQPLSQPLLRDLMQRVAACEQAGGTLRTISITAYPDEGVGRAQADREIATRQQAVRSALVALGAPAGRIVLTRDRAERGAPMQRRVEVLADLW